MGTVIDICNRLKSFISLKPSFSYNKNGGNKNNDNNETLE